MRLVPHSTQILSRSLSSLKSSPATLLVRFSSERWTSWRLVSFLSCPTSTERPGSSRPSSASSPCRRLLSVTPSVSQLQAWDWVSLRWSSRSLAHIQPVLRVPPAGGAGNPDTAGLRLPSSLSRESSALAKKPGPGRPCSSPVLNSVSHLGGL